MEIHALDNENTNAQKADKLPIQSHRGRLMTAEGAWDYEPVAASQTDQALGATGATGDLLASVIISVGTSATGTCSIKDGGGSAIVLTAANTPIGVYSVYMSIKSTSGAWKITTGAGATAIGIGKFT